MTLLPEGVRVHLAVGHVGDGPGSFEARSVYRASLRVPRPQGELDQDHLLGRHWALPVYQAARAWRLPLAVRKRAWKIDCTRL